MSKTGWKQHLKGVTDGLKDAAKEIGDKVGGEIDKMRKDPKAVVDKMRDGTVKTAQDAKKRFEDIVERPSLVMDLAVDWAMCRPEFTHMVEEFGKSDKDEATVKAEAIERFKQQYNPLDVRSAGFWDSLIAVVPGLHLLGLKALVETTFPNTFANHWGAKVAQEAMTYRADPQAYDAKRKKRFDWTKKLRPPFK